jgi:putative Mn2+ efflux pump MntP
VDKVNKPETARITRLVLKAVAVGMSVASIVMGFIPSVADTDTQMTLLSIGLAALAVAALKQED